MALENTLTIVNDTLHPVQPVTMTIGDEFQGLFADLADAVTASFRIGFELGDMVGIRVGIGWGELALTTERPPFGQDGPCWWRAREAIEAVEKSESSNSVPRTIRTLARTGGDDEALLNAYLVARDHIVAGWDDTDRAIARLILSGATQAEAAERVGLSQSSVSRRIQGHGVLAVLRYQL